MKDFFIIDAHLHTYKTAETALQAMGGESKAGCLGTPEELMGVMDEAGIDMSVQLNMTPAFAMYQAAMEKLPLENRDTGRQGIVDVMTGRVQRRNRWSCEVSKGNPRLVAFPSVDPLMGEKAMIREIEELVKQYDIRGIKIHPAEGHFFPDDPSLWAVYDAAQRHGLTVISHGGAFLSDKEYTRPENFSRILDTFKELTLVVAHLGLMYWDEAVGIAEQYPNVYFDTSAAFHGDDFNKPLTDGEAVDLIRKIGVNRVMFGSDYPWHHPGRALKRFLGLSFSEKEKAAILGENARNLLHL
jgi:uncharacterized protein